MLVDVQTIGVLVTAASVSVAAIYYKYNLRISLQTRQAQLFMPIFAHSYSEIFMRDMRTILAWQWKDFDEYMQKYGVMADKVEDEAFLRIWAYLEGIGVLVNNRLIDPKLERIKPPNFSVKY